MIRQWNGGGLYTREHAMLWVAPRQRARFLAAKDLIRARKRVGDGMADEVEGTRAQVVFVRVAYHFASSRLVVLHYVDYLLFHERYFLQEDKVRGQIVYYFEVRSFQGVNFGGC